MAQEPMLSAKCKKTPLNSHSLKWLLALFLYLFLCVKCGSFKEKYFHILSVWVDFFIKAQTKCVFMCANRILFFIFGWEKSPRGSMCAPLHSLLHHNNRTVWHSTRVFSGRDAGGRWILDEPYCLLRSILRYTLLYGRLLLFAADVATTECC